jgi:hypothetical protein
MRTRTGQLIASAFAFAFFFKPKGAGPACKQDIGQNTSGCSPREQVHVSKEHFGWNRSIFLMYQLSEIKVYIDLTYT